MSWYEGHLRQFAYTTYSSGVTLLAMADWTPDEYLSQNQPIHWVVLFSQEFEIEAIKIRVSLKESSRGEAVLLDHVQLDGKIEGACLLREQHKDRAT